MRCQELHICAGYDGNIIRICALLRYGQKGIELQIMGDMAITRSIFDLACGPSPSLRGTGNPSTWQSRRLQASLSPWMSEMSY